jgi:hypothetical protein
MVNIGEETAAADSADALGLVSTSSSARAVTAVNKTRRPISTSGA